MDRVRREGARQGARLAANGMLARALPVARGAAATAGEELRGFLAIEGDWRAAASAHGRGGGRGSFVRVCDAVMVAAAACEDGAARIVGGGGRRPELGAAVRDILDGAAAMRAAAAQGAALPLAAVAEALAPLVDRVSTDLLRDTPELGRVVGGCERAVARLERKIAADEARAAAAAGDAGWAAPTAEVRELEAAHEAKERVWRKKVAVAEQLVLRIEAVSGARAVYERIAGMAESTAAEGGRLEQRLATVDAGLVARLEDAVRVRCACCVTCVAWRASVRDEALTPPPHTHTHTQAASGAAGALRAAQDADVADETAYADGLARHIEELRCREATLRGSPDGVMRGLLLLSVARAVAEANLAAWRAGGGARERAGVRDAAMTALVAARTHAADAVARARAVLAFAEHARSVCRAAAACFRVVHRMCADASGADLAVSCTRAFQLASDARFGFDVSRLSVLHRGAALERWRGEFEAEKQKPDHLQARARMAVCVPVCWRRATYGCPNAAARAHGNTHSRMRAPCDLWDIRMRAGPRTGAPLCASASRVARTRCVCARRAPADVAQAARPR